MAPLIFYVNKLFFINKIKNFEDVGHIKTLQKAKEMGTFLLVGIHDDEVFYIIILEIKIFWI